MKLVFGNLNVQRNRVTELRLMQGELGETTSASTEFGEFKPYFFSKKGKSYSARYLKNSYSPSGNITGYLSEYSRFIRYRNKDGRLFCLDSDTQAERDKSLFLVSSKNDTIHIEKDTMLMLDDVQNSMWTSSDAYKNFFGDSDYKKTTYLTKSIIDSFVKNFSADTDSPNKMRDFRAFISDIYDVNVFYFTKDSRKHKLNFKADGMDLYYPKNYKEGMIEIECKEIKIDVLKPKKTFKHIAEVNKLNKVDDSLFINTEVFDNLQPNTLIPNLNPSNASLRTHEIKTFGIYNDQMIKTYFTPSNIMTHLIGITTLQDSLVVDKSISYKYVKIIQEKIYNRFASDIKINSIFKDFFTKNISNTINPTRAFLFLSNTFSVAFFNFLLSTSVNFSKYISGI